MSQDRRKDERGQGALRPCLPWLRSCSRVDLASCTSVQESSPKPWPRSCSSFRRASRLAVLRSEGAAEPRGKAKPLEEGLNSSQKRQHTFCWNGRANGSIAMRTIRDACAKLA